MVRFICTYGIFLILFLQATHAYSAGGFTPGLSAGHVQSAESTGSSFGPYFDYVKCAQALKGKSRTQNAIDDPEVLLPGQLGDGEKAQPGIFWFDRFGQAYFFNTKVDYPEMDTFRKLTPDSEHWIVDIEGAKRLYYQDDETDKVYHYGFFLRVQKGDQMQPFRFVWTKEKTLSNNSEAKYESIPEFARTLHAVRRKWSRRIIARSLVSIGHRVDAHGARHPSAEKVLLDEIKAQLPSVYFSYIDEGKSRSEHRAPASTSGYVKALKECEKLHQPQILGLVHDQLHRFDQNKGKEETQRGIASISSEKKSVVIKAKDERSATRDDNELIHAED